MPAYEATMIYQDGTQWTVRPRTNPIQTTAVLEAAGVAYQAAAGDSRWKATSILVIDCATGNGKNVSVESACRFLGVAADPAPDTAQPGFDPKMVKWRYDRRTIAAFKKDPDVLALYKQPGGRDKITSFYEGVLNMVGVKNAEGQSLTPVNCETIAITGGLGTQCMKVADQMGAPHDEAHLRALAVAVAHTVHMPNANDHLWFAMAACRHELAEVERTLNQIRDNEDADPAPGL